MGKVHFLYIMIKTNNFGIILISRLSVKNANPGISPLPVDFREGFMSII